MLRSGIRRHLVDCGPSRKRIRAPLHGRPGDCCQSRRPLTDSSGPLYDRRFLVTHSRSCRQLDRSGILKSSRPTALGRGGFDKSRSMKSLSSSVSTFFSPQSPPARNREKSPSPDLLQFTISNNTAGTGLDRASIPSAASSLSVLPHTRRIHEIALCSCSTSRLSTRVPIPQLSPMTSLSYHPTIQRQFTPLSRSLSQSVGTLAVRRWMSSTKGDTPDKNATELEQATKTKEDMDSSLTNNIGKATEESVSGDTPRKNPTEILNQQIKRVMETNIGDQLSVVFIFGLLIAVLLAPQVVQRVKSTEGSHVDEIFDDFFSADDPIDDLTKLARTEWGTASEDDEEEVLDENGSVIDHKKKKNALEIMLSDVLQSQALQQAAQQFVIQTLQSQPVQDALKRLVKTLWTDLMNDPESIAQVVQLLNFAIQNPRVRESVRQLALDIIEDPEVKQSLIELLQRLGRDDAVMEATKSLLTQSAHSTLNDPEILDHSMEFATDVVGDDIVQRTAGEALRNTVGHAVRPATTVLLTALGVGMMILGVVSIGYARSSEQEAILFESAARSLHTNAINGIVRLLSWPLRAGQNLFGTAVVPLIAVPLQWSKHLVNAVAAGISRLATRYTNIVFDGFGIVARKTGDSVGNIGNRLAGYIQYLLGAVAESCVSLLAKIKGRARSSSENVVRATSDALARSYSRLLKLLSVQAAAFLSLIQQGVSTASRRAADLWAILVELVLSSTGRKPTTNSGAE